MLPFLVSGKAILGTQRCTNNAITTKRNRWFWTWPESMNESNQRIESSTQSTKRINESNLWIESMNLIKEHKHGIWTRNRINWPDQWIEARNVCVNTLKVDPTLHTKPYPVRILCCNNENDFLLPQCPGSLSNVKKQKIKNSPNCPKESGLMSKLLV